jgi:hypothetical protein
LIEAYIFLEDDGGALKMAALYDQLLSRVTNSDKIGRVPRGAQPMRSQVLVV